MTKEDKIIKKHLKEYVRYFSYSGGGWSYEYRTKTPWWKIWERKWLSEWSRNKPKRNNIRNLKKKKLIIVVDNKKYKY